MKNVIKLLADAGKSSAFGLAASGRVLRGSVLLIVSGLMAGVSHSLGAKSLGVRPSISAGIANPTSIDDAVLNPVTPTGSLGSIVQSIILASPDEMVCVVDLRARVVHSRPAAGVNAVALIDAVANTTLLSALKPLEDKRVTIFIEAGETDAAAALADFASFLTTLNPLPRVSFAPAGLQSRSVSSLVSAIEDDFILADVDGGSTELFENGPSANPFLVVDQHTERVTVFDVLGSSLATVRALFNDGGTLEDQERYEQIPAEEAAGAVKLAFE